MVYSVSHMLCSIIIFIPLGHVIGKKSLRIFLNFYFFIFLLISYTMSYVVCPMFRFLQARHRKKLLWLAQHKLKSEIKACHKIVTIYGHINKSGSQLVYTKQYIDGSISDILQCVPLCSIIIFIANGPVIGEKGCFT